MHLNNVLADQKGCTRPKPMHDKGTKPRARWASAFPSGSSLERLVCEVVPSGVTPMGAVRSFFP